MWGFPCWKLKKIAYPFGAQEWTESGKEELQLQCLKSRSLVSYTMLNTGYKCLAADWFECFHVLLPSRWILSGTKIRLEWKQIWGAWPLCWVAQLNVPNCTFTQVYSGPSLVRSKWRWTCNWHERCWHKAVSDSQKWNQEFSIQQSEQHSMEEKSTLRTRGCIIYVWQLSPVLPQGEPYKHLWMASCLLACFFFFFFCVFT